jgi:AcrR family transcriptional regulator
VQNDEPARENTILFSPNRTLAAMTSPRPEESLAAAAIRRRAGDRYAAAEDEVRRLLDAGLELMRSDPGGNPRISEIVRLAKVSNDAFYRAFRSKDDLMAAIADDGARRLLGYIRHQRDKHVDPVEQVRACVRAVFQQAADPEVAATTRAVLRNTTHRSSSSSVTIRRQLAELLVEPLRALSGADPERDALVGSCAMFAVMEQFLWAEERPADADVEHLLGWVLPRRSAVGG